MTKILDIDKSLRQYKISLFCYFYLYELNWS